MLVTPTSSNSLLLTRVECGSLSYTLGNLEYRGQHICFTLEPKVCDGSFQKGLKDGIYPLFNSYSPKFNRFLPEIQVLGRSGIRIHVGNTPAQTNGCILVGLDYDRRGLISSQLAFNKLQEVLKKNRIKFIEIQNFPVK